MPKVPMPQCFIRYFEDLVTEFSEQDRQVVNYLFEHLSLKSQIFIRDALIKEQQPLNMRDIYLLQNRFLRYKKTGVLKKELVDFVLDENGNISDQDREVVQFLFQSLPMQRQENIQAYLDGKLSFLSASNDVRFFLRRFKKYKEKGLYPELLGRSRIRDKIASEQEKRVFYAFIQLLPDEEQRVVQEYLYGKINKIDNKLRSCVYSLWNRALEISRDDVDKACLLLREIKKFERAFYAYGYSYFDFKHFGKMKEKEFIERGITSSLDMMVQFLEEGYLFIKDSARELKR